VLHEALKRERPELSSSRWLIEDQIFYAPVIGTLLNRLGAVRANPENAVRLLEENRPLIVFPEGIHGLQKPYAERYQLKRFGRGGFVKIALQTGVPIFPVAIVGAEETSPMLARIPTTVFGMPYLPLSPLGPLPLPAKWHIRIGAPITVDDLKSAGDEESVRVQRGTELTREAIQGMLEAILRDRPNAFR
jgi:1-acyl-sn-glycerol-3-phosphate acyltransferase